MLILTRKAEQGIIIDGQITVRVLSIDGERVKIGIVAPNSIAVLREELVQAVAGENRQAARPAEGAAIVRRLRSLEVDASGRPVIPTTPPEGEPPRNGGSGGAPPRLGR